VPQGAVPESQPTPPQPAPAVSPVLAPEFRVDSAEEAHKLAYDLLNQGTALYTAGDYREAIEKLRIAAAIGLNSFEAHYYLGLALSGARRYQDAIEPFEMAIDLQPNHLQSHVSLGDALLKMGDRDRADAEYHRALKIKDDFAPALDGLGRLAEAQGKSTEAEEFYKKA